MTIKAFDRNVLKEAPRNLRSQIDQILRSASREGGSLYEYLSHKIRRNVEEEEVINSTFWLLAHSGNNRAFNFLMSVALSRDQNIKLRRAACWALGYVHSQKSAKILLSLFRSAKDRILLWEAAKGLTSSQKHFLASPVIRILKNSSLVVRREAAAYILGSLSGNDVVNALLATLRKHSEKDNVRGQAAESLGYIRDTRAVPFLLESLHDKSAEVRFWSAFALGKLGDKRAIPELRRLAKSDNSVIPGWWSVRKEANAAIKELRESSQYL